MNEKSQMQEDINEHLKNENLITTKHNEAFEDNYIEFEILGEVTIIYLIIGHI